MSELRRRVQLTCRAGLRVLSRGAAFGLVFLCFSAPAAAQGTGGSHWGVSGAWAPRWESIDRLTEKTMDWIGPIEGREFTIGIVRGSTRGGEWGVSFVQKPFEDGTSMTEVEASCDNGACFSTSTSTVMRDVQLRGVEFHWFRPFGTIANRLQIGLNLAGGIARPEGTIERTSVTNVTFENPFTGEVFEDTFSNSFEDAADEFLYPYIALFKIEAQAAIIVAPAFKIKVAGGVSNPGAGVWVGFTVLFGAR